MTTNNDSCPRCDGTVNQRTWTSDGRTIHGAMECEDCDWTETDGQPCDKCGVYVPTGDHCGNDRADGTSEYLCPDCYTPEGEGLTCGCGHSGADVVPTHGHESTCFACIAKVAERLDKDATREQVIWWLRGNDRHGCYSDEDMIAEGWEPMTLAQAWAQVAIYVEDDLTGEA